MENIQNILHEKMNIIFTSSFLFFLMFMVALKCGYLTSSRQDPNEKPSIRGKDVLYAFGIFLGLQLFLLPFLLQIFYSIFSDQNISTSLKKDWGGWYNISAIFFTFVGLSIYLNKLPDIKKSAIWGAFAFKGIKARLKDFFIAFFSWLLSYPLVVAIGQIVSLMVMFFYKYIQPEQVAVDQIKQAAASRFEFSALIFCVVILVPFIEELLFRGFLQNWLKAHVSNIKAIVITSAIFSSFHFSPTQGVGNIELIVSLFVLSCFLCYIYERQKSLWASIFMHSLFNAISIFLIFA